MSTAVLHAQTLALDRGNHHITTVPMTPSPSHSTNNPGTLDTAADDTNSSAAPVGKPAEQDARRDERTRAGNDKPAGKVRKRLQLACANCRRRKTKCTGTFPTCGHCLRARIPCVYKISRKPAAPRSNYMAMLDRQMHKMEGRILGLVAGAGAASSPRPISPGPEVREAPSRDEDLDRDEFWTGPELAEDHGRDSPPPVALPSSTRRKELMLEGSEALPPADIQEHLSKIFFTHLYGQPYFLLHKPSYMAKLRSGRLPPVLILTVCAIAARFSAHPSIQVTPKFLSGEQWARHARRICTSRLDTPNLTILTCLVLLSLHDFGTCHGARSWAIGGQAIRMAFALRLHREDEDDGEGHSFVDTEIRRRIMWACFIIDRFNSSSTARPIFIRDEMIDIPEPIREDSFLLGLPRTEPSPASPAVEGDWEGLRAKDSASVAAHMVRAVSVWGKIISYLNQGGRELDPYPMWDPRSQLSALSEQAERVSSSLPASLAYSDVAISIHEADSTLGQFFFLHAIVQQNILSLNHAILASPQGVPRQSLMRATTRAFVAAARISHLLAAVGSRPVNAPFVGYSAFSSAMIQLEGIFSGNTWIENSTRRRLTANIKYLHRMKHHWGVFHWMIEKIRERYRHFSSRAVRATRGQVEAGSRAIGDYAEWFERYPRGVSHTNFVDPADPTKDDSGDEGVLEQKPDWITVGEYLARTAPPPDEPSEQGAGASFDFDVQDDELERLLMSLDEAMPAMNQDGMSSMAGPWDSSQFTGDTFPLANTSQVPGAYYGFLDRFPADRDISFELPDIGGTDGLVQPNEASCPSVEMSGGHGVVGGIGEGGGEGQGQGDGDGEDVEMRESENIIEAWSAGLDVLPTGITSAAQSMR